MRHNLPAQLALACAFFALSAAMLVLSGLYTHGFSETLLRTSHDKHVQPVVELYQLERAAATTITSAIDRLEHGTIGWAAARAQIGLARRQVSTAWRKQLERAPEQHQPAARPVLARQLGELEAALRELTAILDGENLQELHRFTGQTWPKVLDPLGRALEEEIAATLRQSGKTDQAELKLLAQYQQVFVLLGLIATLLPMLAALLILRVLRRDLRRMHLALGADETHARRANLETAIEQAEALHLTLSTQNEAMLTLQAHLHDAQQAQQTTQTKLAESESLRTLLLNASGEGFWEWRLKSDHSRFSPRWFVLLGYSESEAPKTAQAWLDLVHPDDRPLAEATLLGFSSGNLNAYEFEARLRHKTGEWKHILFRAVCRRQGQETILAGAHADKSREYELKTALESAQRDQIQARADQQLSQAEMMRSVKFAALGRISSGISHEISTPIGIVLTAASSLADETSQIDAALQNGQIKKSDLNRYVALAQEASQLILKHSGQAAELSRSFRHVAVDQATEEKRQFFIENYFSAILLSLAPLFKHTPHRLVFECRKNIEIDSYPGVFTQIFTNLVTNALFHAFSSEHPGTLTITSEVTTDQHLQLSFSDNGRGIPAELQEKAFEPFYTTKKGKGCSGLGLTMTKILVTEKLSGRIWTEDTPGGGVTVMISIPTGTAMPEKEGARA